MSVAKMVTLHEIAKAARRNLTQHVWDYMAGATETETTLKRNRMGLDSLAFRPRVLRDTSNVETRSSLLGHELKLPLVLPPIGSLQLFEAGGGASVAQAAERTGTLSFLSSVCTPELEEVAMASSAPKVYQLYLFGDGAWLDERIKRAEAAGYAGFCLTVDTAVYSRRERDLVKRYMPPSGRQVGDFGYQAKMSWDLVKRIKDTFEIPLVLKGIATAEDAALAVEHGTDVVYVSNHGGRQLDHGRGAIEVLPEVVEAVGGKAEIVVDGGFVRGTDVVKGLALGADAVGIGRLECLGMAAGGADGVVRVLEILESEIRICLALLGVTCLGELSPSYLHPAQPVVEPHVTSAFPFLDLGEERY